MTDKTLQKRNQAIELLKKHFKGKFLEETIKDILETEKVANNFKTVEQLRSAIKLENSIYGLLSLSDRTLAEIQTAVHEFRIMLFEDRINEIKGVKQNDTNKIIN